MALAKGDKARVVAPVIAGEIGEVKYDENTGEKRLLLEWLDENNESHHRWFKEVELEAAS